MSTDQIPRNHRQRGEGAYQGDPVAKPAAHSRAESRGSRPPKAAPGERRTLRWREVDSNPRSLSLDSRRGWSRKTPSLFTGGPAVRITFAPAGRLLRTCSSRLESGIPAGM